MGQADTHAEACWLEGVSAWLALFPYVVCAGLAQVWCWKGAGAGAHEQRSRGIAGPPTENLGSMSGLQNEPDHAETKLSLKDRYGHALILQAARERNISNTPGSDPLWSAHSTCQWPQSPTRAHNRQRRLPPPHVVDKRQDFGAIVDGQNHCLRVGRPWPRRIRGRPLRRGRPQGNPRVCSHARRQCGETREQRRERCQVGVAPGLP